MTGPEHYRRERAKQARQHAALSDSMEKGVHADG